MLLLIDNYDSFTWNLVHRLGELGAETVVRRNDALTVDEALSMGADGIVISPGPGTPDQAGISLDLVAAAPDDLPVLGVCLGHQTIGQVFGGVVKRAEAIMHGKLSRITHAATGPFADCPQDIAVTRYHSLIVERETLPDCLTVTAETEDGTIMGLSHKSRPVHGLQFHPESIASEHGQTLLGAFLAMTAR